MGLNRSATAAGTDDRKQRSPVSEPNALPDSFVHMAAASEFDTDTAVRRASGTPGPGRWLADLTNRWDINDKPNGGYVLATAVRAMAGAVPDHPHPFTVTAHYLRPSQSGPVEIDVEVVRTGRKLATVSASFVQAGKERIRLLGTFGNLTEAKGPTVVRATPPELPPIGSCVRRQHDEGPLHPMSNIGDRTETYLDPATGWVNGTPNGVAVVKAWTRFADGRAPDVWSLPFYVDAMPPAVFEVLEGAQWVPTIELTVHIRGVPAPGWLRTVMSTRFLMDGYLEEDGEIWDSTGTLVAQSRQFGMIFRP